MAGSMCEPLNRAEPTDVALAGIGITTLGGTRSSVFQRVQAPKSRLIRLRPARHAYEGWRESLMLSKAFTAFALGWPIDINLASGLLLDEAAGIPAWEAERAVEGITSGESKYIELATLALLEAQGCVLKMPNDVSAVLIRDEDFSSCVKVREPLLLSGGEGAEVNALS